MFHVGQKVVYPTHGVGRIESIEQKEVSGSRQSFYILRILGNDMTIMVPTGNAERVGLRQLIGRIHQSHANAQMLEGLLH